MKIHNIEIYRGDTFALGVEVEGVDLSGIDVDMLIKPLKRGDGIKPLLTIDNQVINIELSADQTSAINWQSGEYDLQLTNGAVVTTIMRGKVNVTQDVTP